MAWKVTGGGDVVTQGAVSSLLRCRGLSTSTRQTVHPGTAIQPYFSLSSVYSQDWKVLIYRIQMCACVTGPACPKTWKRDGSSSNTWCNEQKKYLMDILVTRGARTMQPALNEHSDLLKCCFPFPEQDSAHQKLEHTTLGVLFRFWRACGAR